MAVLGPKKDSCLVLPIPATAAPILRRSTDGVTHCLTLATPHATVTVTLTIRGVAISATDLERMLHAPLGVLAGRLSGGCERIG